MPDKVIVAPNIINGGVHIDERGTLSFFNDFDMQSIKRFYIIEHTNKEIRRGWRAHKLENRWFVAAEGEFMINIVRVTDWKNPDPRTKQQSFLLKYSDGQILSIPAGHAFCLQALKANSKLFVFADSTVYDAVNDDYLYPLDYFKEY